MKALNILLIGYGKMGRMVEEVASMKGHNIVGSIDNEKDWEAFERVAKNVDVAIEFSQPDVALNNFRRCLQAGIPLVTGTTGWHQHLDKISHWVKEFNGSFLFATNFSVGMNLFFELNRRMAELTQGKEEFGIGIREIHHTRKLDRPSGTAITLANDILKSHPELKEWINEPVGKEGQLPIESIREGEVTGTHIVYFETPFDVVELRHEALNRKGFAQGAVKAAEWLNNKKGMFEFRNVLFDEKNKED